MFLGALHYTAASITFVPFCSDLAINNLAWRFAVSRLLLGSCAEWLLNCYDLTAGLVIHLSKDNSMSALHHLQEVNALLGALSPQHLLNSVVASDKWAITWSYLNFSYLILSYHTLLYPTLPYYDLPCLIRACHTLPGYILPYRALYYLTKPHLA